MRFKFKYKLQTFRLMIMMLTWIVDALVSPLGDTVTNGKAYLAKLPPDSDIE